MKPILAILTCALLPLTAHGDEPRRLELPQLFSQRAEVAVTAPGLQALELPLEVLRSCRPGLADLRLWADGREVPYLVDTTGTDAWTLVERKDARPGRVRQDRKAPLCDPRGTVDTSHCESIELEAPRTGAGWELVFEPRAERFVERVEIALRHGDKLEPLVQNESIYRLPGGPGERLRLPLPAAAVGAALTVVLQGDGAVLSPRLHFERGSSVRGGDVLEAPLPIASEWRDREGTHLVFDRPRGLLPTSLRLQTSTGAFDRAVRVYDLGGAERQRLIGEGRAARVSLPAAGARVAIDRVEVALGVARERRLELVIEDGDSPRLDDLQVHARVQRPVLIFDRDRIGTLELFFGGGRAEAPRYDLQSLLPATIASDGAEGVRLEIAARLRERAGMARVTLGPIAKNPRFDTTPALAAVAHAGAAVELSVFSHARTLRVAAAPDGLCRYVLAVEDLAAARADLADLRVVDEHGRQWPFLVDDKDVVPQVVTVERPRPSSDKGRTRYELGLPVAPLPIGRIDLDIAEGFFDREVAIVAHDEAGRERRVDGGRLTRKLGSHGPVQLGFPLPRMSAVALEVVDGGDAPLTIERARLHIPTSALALAAVAGRYRLLLGDPEQEAPSYELRALDELIGQLDPAPVTAEPLAANPQFSRGARLRSGGARDRMLVWVVLGAAVIVLGLLTLRMARSEGAGPPPGEGGA
jgi:hypothetical protein